LIREKGRGREPPRRSAVFRNTGGGGGKKRGKKKKKKSAHYAMKKRGGRKGKKRKKKGTNCSWWCRVHVPSPLRGEKQKGREKGGRHPGFFPVPSVAQSAEKKKEGGKTKDGVGPLSPLVLFLTKGWREGGKKKEAECRRELSLACLDYLVSRKGEEKRKGEGTPKSVALADSMLHLLTHIPYFAQGRKKKEKKKGRKSAVGSDGPN